ncbi:dopa 4,5-dioxygenase [Metschnikowia bicuspidata var. bicuspidata NRRL YB-4993]|uniref:Dopa 4,5-dioxygenase n=1 Tax=Metschnikowia bicuspidata var. bicuspidata NRRL YB-4993 TaxID=869754 RepID=A0A1A0H7Z6_9ASCO|nr:dopa 4,5-dioxygenase [Metschnikowia bicuspidata var. bicuspidata NRRL YB-4993]OBA20146.1 dopa 4,5-dioxygenase [Metschnikowia bicuspidata var. bicuspidata NRRL YB-4993]
MAEILSYDFHTYWRDTSAQERRFCWEFREKVCLHFAKEIQQGLLRVHKFWDRPVGPHPIHMWELDTAGRYDPELFARVLAFYQLNHGKLSVLIHPHTSSGMVTDHTEYALWLGQKQRLILGLF